MQPEVNSARVLYEHLEPFSGKDKNKKVREVWAEVFGLEDASQPELLEAFAEVARLPALVRRQVATLDEDEDKTHMLSCLEPIERILGAGLATNCNTYNNHYDAEQRSILYMTADALRRAGLVSPSDDLDAVRGLLDDIAELEAAVLAADELPDFLRQFLLRSIDGLRQSLRHYRITGSSGLLAEIQRITGEVVIITGGDGFDEHADAPEVSKLRTILATAADLATVATATTPLVATVVPLLGGG